MTTRVWINGSEISSNINKLRFAKGMNSEPLPATIEAWGNPQMLLNFDRNADGEDVTSMAVDAWTDESGCDHDGSDIIHEIDVTSGVHSLYLLDQHATTANTFDISYVLPVTVTDGKIIRFKLKIPEMASRNSFFVIKLLEGATIGPHFRLFGYEYGTGYTWFGYTTDNGATWTDTSGPYIDAVFYLEIKLDVTNDNFDWRTGADLAAMGSWVENNDMDNAITTGIDTIQITSCATENDHRETFEWYPLGAFSGASPGGGGTWSIASGVTATVIAGKQGQFVTPAVGGVLTNSYTFTSARTPQANDYIEFKVTSSQVNKNSYLTLYKDSSNYMGIKIWNDAKIYANPSSLLLQAYAAATQYTIRIIWIDSTHYDVKIDATTYTNGGAHYAAQGTVDSLAYWGLVTSNQDGTYKIDDIIMSWDTIDPIEAYLYEIWSDQTIDLDDVRDAPVNVMINSKHSWRGYVCDNDMIDCAPADHQYVLHCKDLMQRMADAHVEDSFLLAQYTINVPGGGMTDNRVELDDVPDLNLIGMGAIIALNPNENSYTADADSLKSSAEPTGTYSSKTGAHTDTQTKDDTFQTITKGNKSTAYADYVLTRASAAETVKTLRIRLEGKFYAGGVGGSLYISLLDSAGTEGPRRLLSSYPYSGTSSFYPISTYMDVLDPATYCYEDGGNWEVTVRFWFIEIPGHSDHDTEIIYIDKLRAEMVAIDEPFKPIEAEIFNIDVVNKYVYIDAAPLVDSFLHDADLLKIGPRIRDVQINMASADFNVIDVPMINRWIAQDMIGASRFDVWKHCCNILGGYWYWQLDEDSGASSLIHVPNVMRQRHDENFIHIDGSELADSEEWTYGIGNGATVGQGSGANVGYYLELHGEHSGGETTGYFTCTRDYGGIGDSMKRIEFSIQENAVVEDDTPVLEVRFLNSSNTTRYRIVFDTDHKPTAYGTADNSGQINHVIATAADFSTIIVEFTATNAALSIIDAGSDTIDSLDATRAITNDITKVQFAYDAATAGDDVADDVTYYIGHLNGDMNQNPSSTTVAVQSMPKRSQHARSISRVRVIGKHDQYAIDVTAGSPRDLVIVDESLVTMGAVQARATFLAEKYTSDTRSIAVQPEDSNTNFQVGDFYQITFDGSSITDLVCRRAEFEWTPEKREEWSLELDTGETSGHERLAKLFSTTRSDINSMRISRIADD